MSLLPLIIYNASWPLNNYSWYLTCIYICTSSDGDLHLCFLPARKVQSHGFAKHSCMHSSCLPMQWLLCCSPPSFILFCSWYPMKFPNANPSMEELEVPATISAISVKLLSAAVFTTTTLKSGSFRYCIALRSVIHGCQRFAYYVGVHQVHHPWAGACWMTVSAHGLLLHTLSEMDLITIVHDMFLFCLPKYMQDVHPNFKADSQEHLAQRTDGLMSQSLCTMPSICSSPSMAAEDDDSPDS